MEKILQIIDANQNRAREGLRIAEEICRFVLEDESLTADLKGLRHRIGDLVDRFYGSDLLKEREVERDVGKGLDRIRIEKDGYIGVARLNLSRVEEALRVMEEFSKLSKSEVALQFKKLRFDVYEIEKEIYSALSRLERRVKMKGLYAICDLALVGDRYRDFTIGVVEGGATMVQLRGKDAGVRDLITAGRRLRELLKGKGVVFIVNDRVDVALCVGADGVHLGQDDMPINLARDLLGHDRIIGISTHNLDEVKRAVEDGADYVSFGPIYETLTKPEVSPVGPDLLPRVREITSIPLFAIGGINRENIQSLIGTGIDGVVCASYLAGAKSVVEAACKISERFRSKQR